MRRHGGGLPIERFAALRRAKDIVGPAALAWIQHDASTMGAALAFYTVFSVAPILIIAIGVLDLFVGTDTVKAELLPQMQILFGDAGASAVQALLLSATLMGNSHVATLVGVATLLIGASSVFVELQNSLDRASFLGEWRTWLLVVDVTLSLSITTVLFAFVYKYIPQAKMEWSDVWVGAAVAAILFNIGKFAVGYYLGRSAFATIYGAVGSLLVVLLWAYYSAQIFLFGAEFTKTFSFISGTRRGLKV